MDSGFIFIAGETIKLIDCPTSSWIIIIGAHYDSVGTKGVDDNGSGVSVLLESCFRQFDQPQEYTLKYIFFGAEEEGMEGSKHYVKCMSDTEKNQIKLMINIDSVLAGDYHYILGGVSHYDGTTTQIEPLMKTYELAKDLELDVRLNETGAKFPKYTAYPKERSLCVFVCRYSIFVFLGR